jgi:hypothetical protein
LNFITDFNESFQFKISPKPIQRDPSCSMPISGQTDVTNPVGIFPIFVNAPKIVFTYVLSRVIYRAHIPSKIGGLQFDLHGATSVRFCSTSHLIN